MAISQLFPSFPTRRSSDLHRASGVLCAGHGIDQWADIKAWRELLLVEERLHFAHRRVKAVAVAVGIERSERQKRGLRQREVLDRKSTRLNSSHRCISYAVF